MLAPSKLHGGKKVYGNPTSIRRVENTASYANLHANANAVLLPLASLHKMKTSDKPTAMV